MLILQQSKKANRSKKTFAFPSISLPKFSNNETPVVIIGINTQTVYLYVRTKLNKTLPMAARAMNETITLAIQSLINSSSSSETILIDALKYAHVSLEDMWFVNVRGETLLSP